MPSNDQNIYLKEAFRLSVGLNAQVICSQEMYVVVIVFINKTD